MSKSTGYKHNGETLERLFWEFDDKRKGGGERVAFKEALAGYANSFYVAPDTRYQAEEAECAHMVLDSIGVPRTDKASGETYSLVGRMELYKSWGTAVPKDGYNVMIGGSIGLNGTPLGAHRAVKRLNALLAENARLCLLTGKLAAQLKDANHLVKQYELLDLLPGGLM